MFGDKYNLDKVARLPNETIKIGTISVTQEVENNPSYEYLFILDKFNIDLPYLFREDKPSEKKEYTFMLIIPKKVIADKIDEVHEDVGNDIRDVFIIPFALFSFIMMLVISYFLSKISKHITKPIIELFQKIQDIITAHQIEKNMLIEEQKQQNQPNFSGGDQISKQ